MSSISILTLPQLCSIEIVVAIVKQSFIFFSVTAKGQYQRHRRIVDGQHLTESSQDWIGKAIVARGYSFGIGEKFEVWKCNRCATEIS